MIESLYIQATLADRGQAHSLIVISFLDPR